MKERHLQWRGVILLVPGQDALLDAWRQLNEAFILELSQQEPADLIFEGPVILSPVPEKTELLGNVGAAAAPMLMNKVLDLFDLGIADTLVANDQGLVHGLVLLVWRPNLSSPEFERKRYTGVHKRVMLPVFMADS